MSILNSKCNDWIRFSKYERRYIKGKSYVFCKAEKTKMITYNPFETADELLVDFLKIGWAKTHNKAESFRELTEKFANKYGMLTIHAADKTEEYEDESLIISEAEKLYLHFYEYNRDMRQPELACAEPSWIFDPISVPMTVQLIDNLPTIVWDTDNLLTAIKLAYALLITENSPRLKYCKHCHVAYWGTNPKSEFCSPRCRNQWNVYRSRGRGK